MSNSTPIKRIVFVCPECEGLSMKRIPDPSRVIWYDPRTWQAHKFVDCAKCGGHGKQSGIIQSN